MADEIVPEEVVEEVPEEEVVPVEEPETEEPPVEEVPEEIPEEEPKPPSRRENLRIQSLIERLKVQETPVSKPQGALDLATALDADPEVIARLQADRDSLGNERYQAGLQKAESIQFHTRLEIDAPKIEAKYPVLDTQATEFDPVVANAVNQWYLATAGYDSKTGAVQNSQVRYSEFVEGIMELADVLAGEKTTEAKKTIAKQAANTGIRPGGTVAKSLNLNKEAHDMSDEELDAKLATVFGRK